MMNINPVQYNIFNLPQRCAAKILINEIKHYIQSKGINVIIDVGCGTGNITTDLLCSLPHQKAIAFDRSQEMIAFARVNYNRINLEYKIADITDPSSKLFNDLDLKGQVDLVTAINSLHYSSGNKLEQAINNISTMLESGGHCFVLMPNTGELQDSIDQFSKDPKWAHLFTNYDPVHFEDPILVNNNWIRLCNKYGLKILSFDVIETNHKYEYGHFEDYIFSFCHLLKLVPEHEHQQFIIDFKDYFKKSKFSKINYNQTNETVNFNRSSLKIVLLKL